MIYETSCCSSVSGRGPNFLYYNRNADRGGLLDLYQGIGHEYIRGEYGTPQGARGVNWIGCGRIDGFHMMAGAADGDTRRVGLHLNDLLSGRKHSGDSRMHFHLAGYARVERKMQLAGHDLADADISWMTHQLRSEIVSAITCLGIG